MSLMRMHRWGHATSSCWLCGGAHGSDFSRTPLSSTSCIFTVAFFSFRGLLFLGFQSNIHNRVQPLHFSVGHFLVMAFGTLPGGARYLSASPARCVVAGGSKSKRRASNTNPTNVYRTSTKHLSTIQRTCVEHLWNIRRLSIEQPAQSPTSIY